MADGMSSLLVLMLQGVGLSTLALSQIAHWRKVMADEPFPGPRALRWTALLALTLGLLLSQAIMGVAMGMVFWFLALLPCGMVVTLLLCWRGSWLRGLGRLFKA
ncbi:hypothetical protein BK653_12210 [Pseudomonas brassicacearum]|uniref:DUF3325 family protein n=1 Tax=Pseudomonas brassicacearum TaxID=930166 RepID=UPI000F4679B4|nr:DUF3325 family protein [Pseudomonas brassicacearum]ROM69717.1 hypothetical protein BK653_12210 [Pseudomonas brassicacearum]